MRCTSDGQRSGSTDAGTSSSPRHDTAIATRDRELLAELRGPHGNALRSERVEFEIGLGLGDGLLDQLHEDGGWTREYVVFGQQWWLCVLNRVSEQPERLHSAVADVLGADRPLLRDGRADDCLQNST